MHGVSITAAPILVPRQRRKRRGTARRAAWLAFASRFVLVVLIALAVTQLVAAWH